MKNKAIENMIRKLVYDKYLKSIHDQIVIKILEGNEEVIFTDHWDSGGQFDGEVKGHETPVDWLIERNKKDFVGSEIGIFIRLEMKEQE